MELDFRSVLILHTWLSVLNYQTGVGQSVNVSSLGEAFNRTAAAATAVVPSLAAVVPSLVAPSPAAVAPSLGALLPAHLPDGGRCWAVTLRDVFATGRSVQTLRLVACCNDFNSVLLLLRMSPVNVTGPARCTPRDPPATLTVEVVGGAQLLELLAAPKNESGKTRRCAVVLFYAPWCAFCAQIAPHFNALARAFPQLPIYAIDAMQFSNSNSRFGTVAVPNMLVFHNMKAVARFNHSVKILENMVSFLSNVTGLQPNLSVGLLPSDYLGPLPSKPTDNRDVLLWAAWLFTLVFASIVFVRSSLGHRLCQSLALLGQEHHHIQ